MGGLTTKFGYTKVLRKNNIEFTDLCLFYNLKNQQLLTIGMKFFQAAGNAFHIF